MSKFLIKDADWSTIDGQPCKVIRFSPLAKIENRMIVSSDMTTPYALLALECPALAPDTGGSIAHKLDFKHLWAAFVERKNNDDEEIIISWNKKKLKGFSRFFSSFMPGLVVMVCKSGSYELMTDPQCRPELKGQARWMAQVPIVTWMPDFMK